LLHPLQYFLDVTLCPWELGTQKLTVKAISAVSTAVNERRGGTPNAELVDDVKGHVVAEKMALEFMDGLTEAGALLMVQLQEVSLPSTSKSADITAKTTPMTIYIFTLLRSNCY
jgi:hypothetical protein